MGVVEIANRDRDPVRAVDAVLHGDGALRVRCPGVALDRDELVRDPARVREAEHRLAEALAPRRGEAVVTEALLPEVDRSRADRERERLDLTAPASRDPSGLPHREARDEGALLARVVAVVKMEDRRVPVVERRLLDALHAEDLRVEVIVLLRVADVERDVVVPLDVRIRFHFRDLLLTPGLQPQKYLFLPCPSGFDRGIPTGP